MEFIKSFKGYRSKISQLFLGFFLFVFAVCSSFGQAVNKKKITEDDYGLWSTLYAPVISNDGQWAAWKLNYKGVSDSLLVINTKSRRTMKYDNTREHNFSPNSKWIYNFEPNRNLYLISLEDGESILFKDLALFYFSEGGDYAGVLDANKNFILVDLESGEMERFENISWFAFSPNGKYTAITTVTGSKNTIELLDTRSLQRTVLLSSEQSSFMNMAWNLESTGLVFMEEFKGDDEEASSTTLYEFRNGDMPKLRSLNPRWQRDFPFNTYISARDEVYYAADGQRIMFNVRPKSFLECNLDSLKSSIQIWKGDDKWIVPRRLRNANAEDGPWLTMWNPDTKEVLPVADDKLPGAFILPNENYALLFDEKQYEPSYKYRGDSDLYVMNLVTKQKKLMLRQADPSYNRRYADVDGNFIAYYKDSNWWVYDVKSDTHINVSVNIPNSLETGDNYSSGKTVPYGFAGWSGDSKWIYIYDAFDIWKIRKDGKEAHRITSGWEQGITYRVYEKTFEEFPFQRFGRFPLRNIVCEEEVVLEGTNANGSGFYIYNCKDGVKPLFVKRRKVGKLKKAKEEGSYIVQEESFDIPRRIYLLRDGKEQLLYESNSHYKQFKTPRQELIRYKNTGGEDLKGILMYPDNYEEGKQYPMVVHIYERLSNTFHEYICPSLYNGDGFNPKLYTGDGYFVLYPDIVYKVGDPGVSAVDCVSAAVEAVLRMGMVDKDRLGLRGHSFGGYEAAFIATQTDMFAAIVSSAGVTDFRSWYLTVGGNTGRENMWWFEEHQWRMGSSYFENIAGYKRNSPMEHVMEVNTPIMLWSGANDRHIDVNQNIQFYLALRRLGKKVELLLYPGERHGLLKLENQVDVSRRVMEWFGVWLK